MLRLNKKVGIFLAIASFAMTLAAQWLHSPLHHLVDAIESEDQRHSHQQDSHQQNSECEETKESESSHCHSHSHHASHSHSHYHAHSTAEDEKGGDATSESNPPCDHHHPDGDCEICQFLAEKSSHSQISVELTGTESVEAASESAAEVVESQTQLRFFIRGPPSHA